MKDKEVKKRKAKAPTTMLYTSLDSLREKVDFGIPWLKDASKEKKFKESREEFYPVIQPAMGDEMYVELPGLERGVLTSRGDDINQFYNLVIRTLIGFALPDTLDPGTSQELSQWASSFNNVAQFEVIPRASRLEAMVGKDEPFQNSLRRGFLRLNSAKSLNGDDPIPPYSEPILQLNGIEAEAYKLMIKTGYLKITEVKFKTNKDGVREATNLTTADKFNQLISFHPSVSLLGGKLWVCHDTEENVKAQVAESVLRVVRNLLFELEAFINEYNAQDHDEELLEHLREDHEELLELYLINVKFKRKTRSEKEEKKKRDIIAKTLNDPQQVAELISEVINDSKWRRKVSESVFSEKYAEEILKVGEVLYESLAPKIHRPKEIMPAWPPGSYVSKYKRAVMPGYRWFPYKPVHFDAVHYLTASLLAAMRESGNSHAIPISNANAYLKEESLTVLTFLHYDLGVPLVGDSASWGNVVPTVQNAVYIEVDENVETLISSIMKVPDGDHVVWWRGDCVYIQLDESGLGHIHGVSEVDPHDAMLRNTGAICTALGELSV